ncbi:MAG TPA: AAA family ATPase, partial [Solirubrobacteraceae bacterium]|nr:AAA family ATPase [Solirubrobacteraceae bacterium]
MDEAQIGEDPSHLLARERELALAADALDAAVRGRGSLVLIAGAAGTGKSTLLAAAARLARRRSVTVRRGRGSEFEEELSFGVIRQLFEPVVLSLAEPERERLLSGAAAAAARLFAPVPLDQGAGVDGGFATLHGLYWLAANVAAEQPLMVVVDDIHWADAPSLRALNYLAGRVEDLPIALFLAYRSNEPSRVATLLAGLESVPAARRVGLGALDLAAVSEVVRAVIPAADDELCAAFHDATAGNPFYVHELLRSLPLANGAPPLPAAVRDAALASVGDRVMRRVAMLGARAPRLAAAMAVLGPTGSIRDAAALAGQDEHDAARAALAMRGVEILAAEDPFEWIHPLVRRSLYDSLTVTERDALHARAAEILRRAGAPAGEIASHLATLRPAGSAEVVSGLLAGVDEALGRDAPEVAVALLRRALEENATEPPRASLLLRLGQIEVTRRNPAAAEPLREARALLRDPGQRTQAAMALAETLTFDGRWDESASTIAAALAELGGADAELT